MPTASTPDWTQLNQLTGASAWTTAADLSLTYVGLRVTISEVASQAAQSSTAAGVLIFCDTLVIDQVTVAFAAPVLQVVARAVIVEAPQAVPVILSTPDGLAGAQWLVESFTGSPLGMAFEIDDSEPGDAAAATDAANGEPTSTESEASQDSASSADNTSDTAPASGSASSDTTPVFLQIDAVPGLPQLVQIQSGEAEATLSSESAAIAGLFGVIGGYQALAASFQAATILLESDPETALAMLRWVMACSSAVANSAGDATPAAAGGLANYAGLFQQATALFLELQSQVAGTRYVPLLSTNFYADEVAGLLPVAESYEQTLQALTITTSTQTTLEGFATTQSANAQATETALTATLQRLATNEAALSSQLLESTAQFSAQLTAAKAAKTTFEAGLASYKTQATVKAVVDTLITIGEVAVAIFQIGSGAGAGAGSATLVATATQEAAAATKAGPSLIESIQGLLQTAKPIFSIGANLGQGGAALVGAVSDALQGPGGSTPDLPQDLSTIQSASVLGLNPVTYWQAFRTQAENDLQPAISGNIGGAQEFLNAIRLLSTYGEAVGNTQLALIRLQGRAADTLGRLQAAQTSQQNWASLAAGIADQQQLEQAQIAAVRRDYLNLKRALFVAVQAYNEAYFYQWLEASGISISLEMDYATLALNCNNLQNDLPALLTGSGTGVAMPPQDFTDVLETVPLTGNPAASWDGSTATWTFTPADCSLPSQLGGSGAIYLTSAQITLDGAEPDPANGVVELTVATSGNYTLAAGGTSYAFVSTPVQMESIYTPATGKTEVSWAFAGSVAAEYLKPSPFTQWKLTLTAGSCPNPTGVTLLLGGMFLQS